MSPKKIKDNVIRAELASSLDLFAEILQKEKVVLDVYPLRKAAEECRKYYIKGMWGYTVENLIFRKLGKLKVFQKDFDLDNATIEFSAIIKGKCDIDSGDDPFESLSLNIQLNGSYLKDGQKLAYGSWHLDKHVASADTEFMHPIYHFSSGGIHFESYLDPKNEAIFLADTPRLVHPPMDAILGVDFIITNFLGNSRSSVRTNGSYANMIRKMQLRLWKPYIDSLAGFWQANAHALTWRPELIWPQLT